MVAHSNRLNRKISSYIKSLTEDFRYFYEILYIQLLPPVRGQSDPDWLKVT